MLLFGHVKLNVYDEPLKKRYHQVGRESHNHLLLLIPSLSLKKPIFVSLFSYKQTNANVIKTHFPLHLIEI
jgi:hypothetical protein